MADETYGGKHRDETSLPPNADETVSILDLIDIDQLQDILDRYSKTTGFDAWLASFPDHDLLVGSWPRDICRSFHRIVPESEQQCRKSNDLLTKDFARLKETNIRTCDNGFIDGATPILVDGHHLADLFIGQVFFEKPDLKRYQRQAEIHGYDLEPYLKVLQQVPVVSVEQFRQALEMLVGLASLISDLAHANLREKQNTRKYHREVEERIQTESALRHSRERYRSYMENSPLGVIIVDDKGRFIEVNPAICRMTGYTAQELLTTGVGGVLTIEPHDDYKYLDESLSKGRTSGSLPYKKKDDTRGWLSFNAVLISDNQILVLCQDTTDQVEAENALRESEDKLRVISEQSLLGIVLIQDNELKYINQAVNDLSGYADEELLQMNIEDFLSMIHPEDVSHVVDQLRKKQLGATKGLLRSYSLRLKTKTGQLKWVEIYSKTITFNGRPADFITVIDITERKQVELEIIQLRNLLSDIINSMPSVLIAIDADGRVTQWNQEADRASGVSAEQARGRVLSDVYSDLGYDVDRIRKFIRDKVVFKNEKVARNRDGKTHYEDITVYPLISGGIEGAVIRVDDVSERVHLEEMMIQSEKMLSVGGLAAGMAHEINNPLAGIMQNTRVLQNRIRPDLEKNRQVAEQCGTTIEAIQDYMEKRELFQVLDMIIESVNRAAEIVSNMLSFSRKGYSSKEGYDLAELLEKTLDLAISDYDLKNRYGYRSIQIDREYQDTPRAMCEKSKIQQVFLNVLINGIEAMVEAKTANPSFKLRVMPNRGMSRVEIEDNGPGMSEEIRKRVFEPFFTTKEVGVGTGLGLSVSYFIVTEHHGGKMSVESRPGKGAKFIIQLPSEVSS